MRPGPSQRRPMRRAEFLVQLHRGDIEPRGHHVAGQVSPSRAELHDASRRRTGRHHLGQAVEQVAAGDQITSDERERPGLVGERPDQGGRQVERGRFVHGVVGRTARDAVVELPGPVPVGGGERIVGRWRREHHLEPLEQGAGLVRRGAHQFGRPRQLRVQPLERHLARAGPPERRPHTPAQPRREDVDRPSPEMHRQRPSTGPWDVDATGRSTCRGFARPRPGRPRTCWPSPR